MKILITGICGFVGSRLALALKDRIEGLQISGIDNLSRPGSESNRSALANKGISFFHGDLRMRSDIEALPDSDWVIDAAANPSVLAGVDGRSSARQVAEHNLGGTLNILEYCRERKAGLVLLSTNRVYSINDLASLPLRENGRKFELDTTQPLPEGVSPAGVTESFPVRQPISIYGATKLSSEVMAFEYALTFGFPVWINRCGVLAGAGQFGTAEQGIFSYWLHAHAARLRLRYLGFGGRGLQVRDAFHPDDLADLIQAQMRGSPNSDPIYHAGGGLANAMSLAELTAWCDEHFGPHAPESDGRPRPFDIPWIVMDCSRAANDFGWKPKRSLESILDEIAVQVHSDPHWLARSAVL
ncbi:MAG TPA: NAD-dependent epimerase/dehydratase family protein [Bryobacteraceae bacterium]|nr:NAD-dependent epimerase/dehydratase family protein [Bryobacteraceae bacterium]